jgi:transposase
LRNRIGDFQISFGVIQTGHWFGGQHEMTKPYSMELREGAVCFVSAGESRLAVAKRLGISVSCVVKWLARHRDTGNGKSCKIGGHVTPKIAGAQRDWLLAQIKRRDVTLQGLTDELAIRSKHYPLLLVTIW